MKQKIILEPDKIDQLVNISQLKSKQSCIGVIIGYKAQNQNYVIKALLPINMRKQIYQKSPLTHTIKRHQQLQRFKDQIQFYLIKGFKVIGLWGYSDKHIENQSKQMEDMYEQMIQLNISIFLSDQEDIQLNDPNACFLIIQPGKENFNTLNMKSFYFSGTDLVQDCSLQVRKAKLETQEYFLVQSSLLLEYWQNNSEGKKIPDVIQDIKDHLIRTLDKKARFQVNQVLYHKDIAHKELFNILDLSSKNGDYSDAVYKINILTPSPVYSVQKFAKKGGKLQFKGKIGTRLYIPANLKFEETVKKGLIQAFDQIVEHSKTQSQIKKEFQPDPFKMSCQLVSQLEYFNLHMPRVVYFKLNDVPIFYQDFITINDSKVSLARRLKKMFGKVPKQIKGEEKLPENSQHDLQQQKQQKKQMLKKSNNDRRIGEGGAMTNQKLIIFLIGIVVVMISVLHSSNLLF